MLWNDDETKGPKTVKHATEGFTTAFGGTARHGHALLLACSAARFLLLTCC